jgi:hypothetical protein
MSAKQRDAEGLAGVHGVDMKAGRGRDHEMPDFAHHDKQQHTRPDDHSSTAPTTQRFHALITAASPTRPELAE